MDSSTTTLGTTLPPALTTSSSLTPQNAGETQKTQFLRLLVAQLQGQNPLDPKDGTEFVTQLAQFSSLEQLINIRTDLDSLVKASTPSTPSTTSTTPTTSSTTKSSNPFEGV